jgi:hypothetical protein
VGVWSEFCRELERAGAVVERAETPDHDIDRAEGYRYLSRLLRIGLDLTLEFADTRNPTLVPAQAPHFGDGGNTADCIYLHAVIDGRLSYRLVGTRGGAPLMEIGLYAGKIGLDPESRRVDALREHEIAVDADGRIEIRLGGWHGTNTLRSTEEANYVFIRQYAHDWAQVEPASLHLELAEEAGSAADQPAEAPLTLDAAAEGLQRAARFVHDAAVAWAAVVDGARRGPPNMLHPVPDDMDMTLPSGHRFAFGHFDLTEDQALLVEFEPADVPYWGLTINNYWFEVVDYGEEGSHINNRTAYVAPDGRVRAVISMRRPPVPNWIDTRGHRVGALVFRWSRTDLPLPPITTRVVPVASLAAR